MGDSPGKKQTIIRGRKQRDVPPGIKIRLIKLGVIIYYSCVRITSTYPY